MYTYANVQMRNNFESRNWIISYPLVYLNTGILDAQKNSPIEMVILSSNRQHMFWLGIFIIGISHMFYGYLFFICRHVHFY